jgi:hypothetical protein
MYPQLPPVEVPKPDVLFLQVSSVTRVDVLTPAARLWIADHAQIEPWQWLTPTCCAVDVRYAASLQQAMLAAGLRLSLESLS